MGQIEGDGPVLKTDLAEDQHEVPCPEPAHAMGPTCFLLPHPEPLSVFQLHKVLSEKRTDSICAGWDRLSADLFIFQVGWKSSPGTIRITALSEGLTDNEGPGCVQVSRTRARSGMVTFGAHLGKAKPLSQSEESQELEGSIDGWGCLETKKYTCFGDFIAENE